MALWAMAFMGTTVIGGPAIGWVGQNVGPRWALAIGALASIAAGFVGLRSAKAGVSAVVALPMHGAAAEAVEESA